MTPAGIEQATFRFEAQHLNHCATAVPRLGIDVPYILDFIIFWIVWQNEVSNLYIFD